MNSVLVFIVAIYLLVNAYATFKTVRTDACSNTRKLYQLLAIWCLPLLGGLVVSLVYLVNPAYGGRYHDVEAGEGGDGGGE